MNRNIVITGVGGQGTVLASRLIAQAAINEGIGVRTAETIGMAQRGGSVLGYIRLFDGVGQDPPFSPVIGAGQADLLVAFEPAEAARNLQLLKKGGFVISAIKPVLPVQAQLSRDKTGSYDIDAVLGWLRAQSDVETLLIDGDAILHELGNSRVLNVVLLGAAASLGALGIGHQSLAQAVDELAPARYLEVNRQALAVGYALGEQYSG